MDEKAGLYFNKQTGRWTDGKIVGIIHETKDIIRFFRGNLPLGIIKKDPNLTVVEMAIMQE